MNRIRLKTLACSALCVASLTSAYANHRTGTFALPELIKAGDFNGDGNLDLAVNVTGFDNFAIFNGDGKGGLSLVGHIATDGLPKGLDVGDINRDQRLDVTTCAAWGYDVLIHLGDGSSGFGHRDNVLNGEGEPTRLLLRDFNNDDRLDIAVNGPEEGVVLIYLGDGAGGFTMPPEEIEGILRDFALDAGDFNNDGNLDIVTTKTSLPNDPDATKVFIYLGNGEGEFSRSASLAAPPGPTSVQVGDLNNDGKLDFILAGAQPANTTGNYLSTYLGDGRGGVTPRQTIDLGTGNLKGEIAIADFNEDGNLDVAFPRTGSQVRQKPSTSVLIYFGDGEGNLTAGPVLTVGKEPHTVIAADMNKDRHLDLIVSNRTDGTVSVLLGNGGGSFALATTKSVVSDQLDR